MQTIAEQMELGGFLVPDRQVGSELKKVVGYEPLCKLNRFGLPSRKLVFLYESLLTVARYREVDSEVVRALLGIWLHGAQLRRELMAIPFHVFRFVDVNANLTVPLWPSVRVELINMAHCLPLMFLDLGLKLPQVLLASDAEGASDVGHGGYGVVGTKVSSHELACMFECSEHLGHTLARASGDLSGLRNTNLLSSPSIPFTKLPHTLFVQERWVSINAGRWKVAEHITLGESRGIVKVLEAVSLVPRLHGSLLFSLCDNMACAGAHSKGRSCVFSFNRTIRRKAVLALSCFIRTLLPWVETIRMPADDLSRDK
jgi:hypothetical protein